MKEYVEYSAKTVDEAITKALLDLGISSDRLTYDIIEKGSAGILGMFSRPAVIRVCKPVEDEDEFLLSEPVKKTEKTETRSEKKFEKKPEKKWEKKAPASAKAEEPVKDESKPVAVEEIAQAAEDSVREEQRPVERPAAQRPARRENGRRDRRENRGSRNSDRESYRASRKNSFKEYEKEAPAEEKTYEKPVLVKPEDPEILALLERVEKFLAEMFGAMSLNVTIETGYEEEDKTILVDLTGDDMGVLIGKRGQTLDSIQYLASLVVNKGEEEYIRVKVDTENYRERRKETLENLARNISYKVKRTKRPVSLEPMNPYERRVIHAALQNDRYVITRSEGVEPYRHIVISPKNTRYNGSRGRDRARDTVRENGKEAVKETENE